MPTVRKVKLLVSMFLIAASSSYAKSISHLYFREKTPANRNPIELSQSGNSIAFLRSFFKWYKTKYDYLDHHIYTVDMDVKTNKPYRINFPKTEEYLSILKMSGFFSDNYINSYRAYFKRIDETLKKTKQNDGPVEGLNYDRIVHSQEPESVLQNLNLIKLSLLKETITDATIKQETPFNMDSYMIYQLKKVKGKYSIDKIDFLTHGKVQQ